LPATLLHRIPPWAAQSLVTALIAIAAAAIAIGVHTILLKFVQRVVDRSASQVDDILVARLAGPTRWIAIGLAEIFGLHAAPLGPHAISILELASGLAVPVLAGWLALAAISAFRDFVELRTDITVTDNLAARRRRTRTNILTRIAAFIIVFLTTAIMLVSIPGVRSVGVTLMASAGLAGLAVGAAAQPALKNIIAGVQMAFSEPIRMDDVVVIEGEWGRIEDIRLTYVVVRIWDERRLIVPVSKFLENSFQNWTRQSSELLGTAFLYVDPASDVSKIRAKLDEVVRAHPKWDGRVVGLQVTDIKHEVMELRALVSAGDAGKAFDLRCDVRELMMAYVASEMPEALPRRRNQLYGQTNGARAQ
jgi:small-conductance mechanosensitive channel